MTQPVPRSAGFSLIEMLVALAIFALVGVAGLTLLDTVLRSNRVTDGRLDAISALDRGLMVVTRDLTTSVPGTLVLDASGLSFERAGEDRLSLTLIRDKTGAMLRQITGGDLPDMVEQTLFGGIEAADWQILDAQKQWHNTWPPASGPARALAAELTLTVEASGILRRLVELPLLAPTQ